MIPLIFQPACLKHPRFLQDTVPSPKQNIERLEGQRETTYCRKNRLIYNLVTVKCIPNKTPAVTATGLSPTNI